MRTFYQLDGSPPRPFVSFRQLAAQLGLHPAAQRIVSKIYQHGQLVQQHDATGVIYAIFYNRPG